MTVKKNIELFNLWLQSEQSTQITFELYGRCKSFALAVMKKSKNLNIDSWATSGTIAGKTTYTIKISKP